MTYLLILLMYWLIVLSQGRGSGRDDKNERPWAFYDAQLWRATFTFSLPHPSNTSLACAAASCVSRISSRTTRARAFANSSISATSDLPSIRFRKSSSSCKSLHEYACSSRPFKSLFWSECLRTDLYKSWHWMGELEQRPQMTVLKCLSNVCIRYCHVKPSKCYGIPL